MAPIGTFDEPTLGRIGYCSKVGPSQEDSGPIREKKSYRRKSPQASLEIILYSLLECFSYVQSSTTLSSLSSHNTTATMRAKRSKQYKKLVQQYQLHHGFREPYQVLGKTARLDVYDI